MTVSSWQATTWATVISLNLCVSLGFSRALMFELMLATAHLKEATILSMTQGESRVGHISCDNPGVRKEWSLAGRKQEKKHMTGINVSSNMIHATNLQQFDIWRISWFTASCWQEIKFVAADFSDSKSQRQLKMPFLKVIFNWVPLCIERRMMKSGSNSVLATPSLQYVFLFKDPMEPTIQCCVQQQEFSRQIQRAISVVIIIIIRIT